MRKSLLTRLFLILVVVAFCMMPVPGYASCPGESSNLLYEYCRDNGGLFSFDEYGWCVDESFYFRNYGVCHCTFYGSYVESNYCYAG